MPNNDLLQVAAVVIYYFPDEQAIKNTLALAHYLPVVVIDNTDSEWSDRATQLAVKDNIVVIHNQQNLGVAKALNQGIRHWIAQGIDWCFLFDQDSQIDSDFIDTMLTELSKSESYVAAYVPLYYAENLQQYGDIIQVTANKLIRISAKQLDQSELIWASYAISSGSLINLASYQAIGEHDENLFIDFVDIEWGLRANALGYRMLTNAKAILKQQLGDKPLFLFGMRIVNHSPIRHYYYFRNVVHMLRKQHVPLIWKRNEILKLPIRFLLYGLFTTNRRQHIKAMLTGFGHGIKNKTGIKK